MTITTESLISECQSLRSIPLNETLHNSYTKSIDYVHNLGLPFDINSADIKKIIIHNIIIDICELKKKVDCNNIFYIQDDNFSKDFYKIAVEVLDRMCINCRIKSPTFFKSFRKFLKNNDLTYIRDVYLKVATNKLALFR